MSEKIPMNLREIARQSGVSRQTASDALRGTGRVAAATRERVLKVATRLGYHPDPLIAIGLAQMRRGRHRRLKSVLAFVETGPFPGLVQRHVAFARMFDGVQRRASELGYSVESFWLGDYIARPGRLEGVLRARGVKGVVFLYVHDWITNVIAPLAFDPDGFACATLGARSRIPELDFAAADHFGNTRLALSSLEGRGYRRIGLVVPGRLDDLVEGRISAAYEGWVREKRGRIRLPPFLDYLPDSEALYQRLKKWQNRSQPDVVYALPHNDNAARLASESRGKITWASMEFHPDDGAPCGLDQAHEEVGTAAADLVNTQLSNGVHGIPAFARGTLVEGHWQTREKSNSSEPAAGTDDDNVSLSVGVALRGEGSRRKR